MSPTASSVQVGQAQKLTASVVNDSQNKGVTWSIGGNSCNAPSACGSLSARSSGSGEAITYTAPAQAPSSMVVVTATSVADASKSAVVSLTVAPASNAITVNITPPTATVQTKHGQNFTATVENDSQSKGVTWSLSGAGCSGDKCGTLSGTSSTSGAPITYTAPNKVPNPTLVTLTATSVSDSTKNATAAITISDGGGPAPITVSISPTTQTLSVSQSHSFTATVQNDAQNMGVNWLLSGIGCNGAACGSLSAASSPSGTAITYTAAATVPNPGTVTLTATSAADTSKSATATITITPGPSSITVMVSPPTQSVAVSQSQSFTATVQNDLQNMGVNWMLSGAGCSGTACGSLSASASPSATAITYTAPATLPNPPNVTLTATSVADNSKAAGASITIFTIPSDLGVTLSPKRGGLTISQTLKFTATVQNDPSNQGVTWSSSGGTLANVTATSAVFHAPDQPGSYKIIVTSNLDSSKTASATIGVTDLDGVTTYHNGLARDGVNSQEYALNSSNVHPSTFGKLFSCTVDAAVYAQPLWVANLSIHGRIHNVVFVATSHDTVYAFDADASPCVTYWAKHLVPSGETWLNYTDVGSDDIQPDIGIVGTPVIDTDTSTLYVVARTKSIGTNCRPTSICHQRLHALNIANGGETSSGPANIAASITVPGNGRGSDGTNLPFETVRENQRTGLALANGMVYVCWGSHSDGTPYHGWVMGFDKSNLQTPPLVFNATPNGEGGGIWMSGGAPSVDSSNNLYVITGNGDYNGTREFGDTFLKLGPNLSVLDWMTPADEAIMNTSNGDLGAGGAAILADLPSGPVRHLLIGGGKSGDGYLGEIYVMNRDAMGHFEGSVAPLVQKFSLGHMIFATPVFWRNTLYLAGQGGAMTAFAFNPTTAQFNPIPTSQSAGTFFQRGATPSLSANSGSHAIVWAADISAVSTPSTILHAYDAANLRRELWNSTQASSGRDQAGGAVRFTVPTIANGKVYLGTSTELDVYGLLPD